MPCELQAGRRYNVGAFRDLCRHAFTAKDLLRMCQDDQDFAPIVSECSDKHSLNDIIDHLMDRCQTHRLFPALDQKIKEINRIQWQEFRDLLYEDGSTLTPLAGMRSTSDVKQLDISIQLEISTISHCAGLQTLTISVRRCPHQLAD